jgi:hypothetical protein
LGGVISRGLGVDLWSGCPRVPPAAIRVVPCPTTQQEIRGMAKRDSYDDDDFLDEEIADWDEDEESDDAEENEIDDESDDVDDDTDDVEDEPDDAPAKEVAESDVDQDDDLDDEEESAAEEEPPVEEEEIVYPPDDEKALAALRKLRVRLDVNDKGNVWRAIFDDTNGKDPSLVLLKGLPALKELWLLGTKVTSKAADSFREEHPKIKVFF